MTTDFHMNYSGWIRKYESVLTGLKDKNNYMLFSGGKDSSAAMHFISKAAKDFGFNFEAHAAAFPVHRYPDSERERIEAYWGKQGVRIIWHDLNVTDDYISSSKSPCFVCQRLRKQVMKKILTESVKKWDELVLIVSYSLWDIVSYCLEHLLSEVFSDSRYNTGSEGKHRFQETGQRFYPLLKMKEGYTIFRPLITYNNDDVLEVVSQKNIPTLSIPCKFTCFRPKKILEEYYEKMGLRFSYNKVFDFARKTLGLSDMSSYTSIEKEEYLRKIF